MSKYVCIYIEHYESPTTSTNWSDACYTGVCIGRGDGRAVLSLTYIEHYSCTGQGLQILNLEALSLLFN
jgi:hypothetical protein